MSTNASPAFGEATNMRFTLRTLLLVGAIVPPFVAALFNAFGSEVRFLAQYVVFQLVLLGAAGAFCFLLVGLFKLERAVRRGDAVSCPDDLHLANSNTDDSKARKELVDLFRIREQIANARYDAGAGALEEVLRAKAVRLKAEIDVLREEASARRLMVAGRR